MNWKQLLRMDLGAALRGGRAPHQGRRARAWRGPVYVPTLAYLFLTFSIFFVMLALWKESWEGPSEWFLAMVFVSATLPPVFVLLWWTERFLYFRRCHMVYVLSVLEGMVRCNVPLPDGLRYASLDAPNPRVASVLVAISDAMMAGAALSEAMKPLVRFFPPGMAELIHVAELSGDLPENLALLIAGEETGEATRARRRDWSLYYGGYSLAALPVALLVTVKVFPQFQSMFADFGIVWPPGPLRPPFDPESMAWLVLFVLAAAALVYSVATVYSAVVAWPRHPASGPAGALLGFVPYLRRIFFKHNLGVAATVAGKALRGGATLDEALAEASAAPVHLRYARMLQAFRGHVLGGRSLSEAIEASGGGLPASFASLVRLGERSGMLAESLEQLGVIYRGDVHRMTLILIDVAAPIGILLFGALVLSISYSLFGSLSAITDALSQIG